MRKEQQIIRDRLQRLIEGIKKANWKDCDREHMARLAEKRINELQQSGVNYVDRFVQKLLHSIDIGKEEYLDILMEGRFAIVLVRNGFSQIEIEFCDKGPDLKARWNRKTIYFEVTRKRPSEDDKRFSHPGAGPYWVTPAESQDILGKIQGELRQLKPSELNVIVLWCDTPEWSWHVVEEAHKYIQQEICTDPNSYADLGAILFTEGGGVDQTTLKEFYLFENNKASKPAGSRLAKKLKSLHERDIRQLKREKKELEAALIRMRAKGN